MSSQSYSQSYSKQNEKTTLSFISISIAQRKCELEIAPAPKDKRNQFLNAIHYCRLHWMAHQMLKAVVPNESLDKYSSHFHEFYEHSTKSQVMIDQYWALYEDQDGIPRFYDHICKIVRKPLQVCVE
jgi:hypothetical protein